MEPIATSGSTSDAVGECLSTISALLLLYFQDSVKSDDVTELIHATQHVHGILDRIHKQAHYKHIDPSSLSFKIFARSLDKFKSVLGEYYHHLVQLNESKQFLRVLNAANLRRTIEQFSSALQFEANILDEKSQYLAKELRLLQQSQPQQQQQLQQQQHPNLIRRVPSVETTSSPQLQQHQQQQQQQVVEIVDPTGQQFWETHIGKTIFLCEFPRFIQSLGSQLSIKITDEQQKIFRQILDHSNTGFISSYKFSEFLKAFGPLTDSIQNVTSLLQEKWFAGWLSVEESRKFLEGQPAGSFLVRFSSSKPGAFAVAFTIAAPGTGSGTKVSHVMINTTSQGTFTLKEQNTERVFKTLHDIIAYYQTLLVYPLDTAITKESWFHGDMEASEAEELLRGKKVGSFLIRFSSQIGYFAGSYVIDSSSSSNTSSSNSSSSSVVAKCLIATQPHYHIVQSEGSSFSGSQSSSPLFGSLSDLVKGYNSIFRFPYKKTTNEVNNKARKNIVNEICETERSYIRSLSTTVQVFMTPLLSTTKTMLAKEEVTAIFSNIPDLLEIHRKFLQSLESVVDNWAPDESEIGPVISLLNTKLKSYTVYVNNYDHAMLTLNKSLKQNTQFKKFVDACLSSGECDQNNITAYLIAPVQRIPRYILLVTDLLKHTPSDHVDYENLCSVLEQLKDSAEYVNESKRLFENNGKLQQIQASLIPQDSFEVFRSSSGNSSSSSGGGGAAAPIQQRMFLKEGNVLERPETGSGSGLSSGGGGSMVSGMSGSGFKEREIEKYCCIPLPDRSENQTKDCCSGNQRKKSLHFAQYDSEAG